MPDWLATVLVAAGSAVIAALAALRRSGRREAEVEARIDAAAKHGESAHTRLDTVERDVGDLKTGRAVHDERITRMGEDIAYIRAGIDELRGRAR